MADVTVERIAHVTLVASTVYEVAFTKNYRSIEVLTRDSNGEVYVIVGSSTQPPKNPEVGAADNEVLPAAISSVEIPSPEAGNTIVKLISSATPAVSVRGLIG